MENFQPLTEAKPKDMQGESHGMTTFTGQRRGTMESNDFYATRFGNSVTKAPECSVKDVNMTNPVCMMKSTHSGNLPDELRPGYDKLSLTK